MEAALLALVKAFFSRSAFFAGGTVGEPFQEGAKVEAEAEEGVSEGS